MFFQTVKRYPLLFRLTFVLASLCVLSYALFISEILYARLETAPVGTQHAAGTGQLGGILLLQIMLGLLFLIGCFLTLRQAKRSLMERIDLALARSCGPDSDGEFPRGRDEVDRLASTLETMATNQSAHLAEMRNSVQQARAQEHLASHSLEFIYRSQRHLIENNVGDTLVKTLLEDMVDSLHASTCTLALLESVARDIGSMPSVIGVPTAPRWLTERSIAELSRTGMRRTVADGENEGGRVEMAVPVKDAMDTYGILVVVIRSDFLFERRQNQTVEIVAGLISLSLGNMLRNQRRRRLALMDERNAIAGELHDSLAQTLAYMKIQVSRLQKELNRSCDQCGTQKNIRIKEISTEIKTGLDSAYRHLRELLTAFRTNMPPGGLQQALREVVDELAARAGTNIGLEYHLENLALSVNEEFHVLQIVREALTNVVRHARARNTTVYLDAQDNREVRVTVTDDGRGALGDTEKEGHYGLSIMQDRAAQIGGILDISAATEDGKGTRVRLRFTPRSQKG